MSRYISLSGAIWFILMAYVTDASSFKRSISMSCWKSDIFLTEICCTTNRQKWYSQGMKFKHNTKTRCILLFCLFWIIKHRDTISACIQKFNIYWQCNKAHQNKPKYAFKDLKAEFKISGALVRFCGSTPLRKN